MLPWTKGLGWYNEGATNEQLAIDTFARQNLAKTSTVSKAWVAFDFPGMMEPQSAGTCVMWIEPEVSLVDDIMIGNIVAVNVNVNVLI